MLIVKNCSTHVKPDRMSSAKIVVTNRVYKDGCTPIFIQIIHNRKKYRVQICKIEEAYLDRSSGSIKSKHPLSHKLNMLIFRTLSETNEYLIDCKLKNIQPDPKTFLNKKSSSDDVATLIEIRAKELLDDQKYRTSQKYQSVANKLRELKLSIPLNQVNMAWIEKVNKAFANHGNVANTRAKDISVISAVLNRVDGFVNPFLKYRKPSNKTTKDKLTMEEFRSLQTVQLEGKEDLARRLFVFSTLGRGIRAFDILTLRWSCISNERLTYTARKTGKYFDIKISPEMLHCLDGLDRQSKYIFPFVRMDYSLLKTETKRFLDNVNRSAYDVNCLLKTVAEKAGIKKHITLHVARHTFAYLADQANVPLGTIQQLLDHGKIGTTQIYVESLRRSDELDKAVEGLF